MKALQHKGCLWVLGVAAVLCCALVLSVILHLDRREAAFTKRIPQLELEFTPLLTWLQEYYTTNGAYPASLPEECRHLMPPYRLGIEYERSADGDRFVLGVGDYLLDGCVLYWDSRDGTWWIDG